MKFDDKHAVCMHEFCVRPMSHLARNLGRFKMTSEALSDHPDGIVDLRGIAEYIEPYSMAS